LGTVSAELAIPLPGRAAGDHAVATFFLLRTPLLPFATFAGLGEAKDEAYVIARMRALLERPEIREALFVASPSFDRALAGWLASGAPADHEVPLTLLRYLARMSTRSTPFGLFAGCSVGRIGEATQLVLGPLASYRRHIRLDAAYLSLLAERFERDPAVREGLRFVPSSGLYEAAGKLRHAEGVTRSESRERTYELVAVSRTPYLDATLARAATANGARLNELAEGLVADDPDVELDEAKEFVASLVSSQLLTSNVSTTVTGPEPIGRIVEALRAAGDAAAAPARILEEARDAMHALDALPPGIPTERFHAIAQGLAGLPVDADVAKLFQVDLYKPAPGATLGGAGARVIEEAISLVARIAVPSPREAMRRFKEAFEQRYGEEQPGPLAARRMVPLSEALDDETGLGFGDTHGSARAPLLDGLPFPTPESASTPLGKREAHVVRGAMETIRSGGAEWRLSDADLEALAPKAPATLPDAFAFLGTLAASSADAAARGDVRVLVESLGGPSAAVLLGRFCHGDPDLHRAVGELVKDEERLRPDAVFAEIVHVPEGRLGNILSRPTLRAYEIPYLGHASVPPERQLPITDLHLVLDRGRVVLFSKRLAREVVPRLSNAHNHPTSRFAIYRFLCALQSDLESWSFGWEWGPLAGAPFLPRVSRGKVVLSLARWLLFKEELAPLAKANRADRFRLVQQIRARRGLPRSIVLADGDRTLPVDLDEPCSVASFAAYVARREAAVVTELFPSEGELLAEGPEGRFAHQIVVPFVRRPARSPVVSEPVARPVPRASRERGPSSGWMSVRLETGMVSADGVLADLVAPFVARARRGKSISRWSFHRHADPRWHLRLVLQGEPSSLVRISHRLEKLAAPFVADGRITRITVDMHDREIERWGGERGAELAEALFEADSEAVLEILSALDGPSAAADRWRLALRGCHDLLIDFGLDLAGRREVVTQAFERLARELRVDKSLEHALGTRFRESRVALDELLAAAPGGSHPLAPGLDAFAARSARVRPLAEALLALEQKGELAVPLRDQVSEVVRMHCARILRSDLRQQRLVIYELLRRLYVSAEARAGRRG
jgi:thiopeptide-type bacteriocin biosynthesis protein